MKKIIIALLSTIFLISCRAPKSLYYWGGNQKGTTAYENLAYLSFAKQTPKTLCDLIEVYENMVSRPGGLRQVPPPGICAEYGYILLQSNTATIFSENATKTQKKLFESDDYGSLFRKRGMEMIKKEIELYPESVKFIEPLIKKLASR